MPHSDIDMELGDHLDELRHRVLVSLSTVALFSIVAFILKENMIDIIFAPSKADFIFNRWMLTLSEWLSLPDLAINQGALDVVNTKMVGQFNLHLKASIVSGLVCSMPVILWQLWGFVKPAISEKMQRKSDWMILQVLLLFFLGLLFGYTFISPLAINFLVGYNFSDNITNLIEVPSYLSTVINISLASAFIFQLPHLVFILSRLGVLSSHTMKKYRRIAIVIIVVISAIITPPDIFSQILIALPFYLLYECGIVIASREEMRKQNR